MKKNIILLVLSVLVLSCKKDENESVALTLQPTNHGPQIKQYRTLIYNNGSIMSINHVNFYYNSSGQLTQNTFLDSTLNGTIWHVYTTLNNITYTPFNKISINGSKYFLYDNNQLIKYSYWYDPEIPSDTIKYDHFSNYIKGSIKFNYIKTTVTDFYSQNLDSSTVFSDSLGVYTDRDIYLYNSIPDLSRNYNLGFYDVNYRQHELLTWTRTNYQTTPATIIIKQYSRTYDGQNYPSSESETINGVLQRKVYYTYY